MLIPTMNVSPRLPLAKVSLKPDSSEAMYLQAIRDISQGARHWHLEEQADRCQCIACQRCEAKAANDCWAIGIEAAEGAVIEERNQEVVPYAPVAGL